MFFLFQQAIVAGLSCCLDTLFLECLSQVGRQEKGRIGNIAFDDYLLTVGGNGTVEIALVVERRSEDQRTVRGAVLRRQVIMELKAGNLRIGREDIGACPYAIAFQLQAIKIIERGDAVAAGAIIATHILVQPFGRDALLVEETFVGDDGSLDPADARFLDRRQPFLEEAGRPMFFLFQQAHG